MQRTRLCYSAGMESVWNLLRVPAGTETLVASRLPFVSYVPHRTQRRFNRKHRRFVVAKRPTLAGIIFHVSSDTIRNSPPGTLGWVRDGNRKRLEISLQDIEDMRYLEKTYWNDLSQGFGEIQETSVVRFTDSSLFEGQTATVKRLSENRGLFELLDGHKIWADIAQVQLVA